MKQVESKLPYLSNPDTSIIKPQELIDIVEMSPLTLNDRRIFNLLLGHAWNDIFTKKTHSINRYDLVKYVDSHNQDIALSFRRLMSAIVQIKIPNNHNGNESIRQIPLLGVNEIETNASEIKYKFPSELVKIIQNTEIFARIHTDVMFQLSSKYSLALYEFIQRRGNLKHIHYEILRIDALRGILGVPKGKLNLFGHLNDRAIQPAIKEVSFLSDFDITAEPIKTGRTVTHIKFAWTRKTDIGKQIAAVEELSRHKSGRTERMNGRVETFTKISDVIIQKIEVPLKALEEAKEIMFALPTNKRLDMYRIEQEFLEYARQNPPKNIYGAFLGFVKKKIKDTGT